MFFAESRLPERMPWSARAACQGLDEEPVRQLCMSCIVRIDCLTYALTYGARGMWGGHDDNDRAKLLRDHSGNVDEAVIASSKLHAVADARARAAAMIRHPSSSEETREVLRNQLKLFDA